MKIPTLDEQIEWINSLRMEHATELALNGEVPGAGTAMITSVYESLRRLREIDNSPVLTIPYPGGSFRTS